MFTHPNYVVFRERFFKVLNMHVWYAFIWLDQVALYRTSSHRETQFKYSNYWFWKQDNIASYTSKSQVHSVSINTIVLSTLPSSNQFSTGGLDLPKLSNQAVLTFFSEPISNLSWSARRYCIENQSQSFFMPSLRFHLKGTHLNSTFVSCLRFFIKRSCHRNIKLRPTSSIICRSSWNFFSIWRIFSLSTVPFSSSGKYRRSQLSIRGTDWYDCSNSARAFESTKWVSWSSLSQPYFLFSYLWTLKCCWQSWKDVGTFTMSSTVRIFFVRTPSPDMCLRMSTAALWSCCFLLWPWWDEV